MQLQLQQQSHILVFIDSDFLKHLDMLFEIVRLQVKWLVGYLTAETLKRPWCMGEITVALRSHGRLVAVRTPTFQPPTLDQLDPSKLHDFLADGSRELERYGLKDEDVSQALRWICSDAPIVEFEGKGLWRFRNLAAALCTYAREESQRVPSTPLSVVSSWKFVTRVAFTSTTRKNTLPLVSLDTFADAVLVSTLRGSDEATAAGGILQTFLQVWGQFATRSVFMLTEQDPLEYTGLKAAMDSARILVVLLSLGTLANLEQLRAMSAAMASPGLQVIPVSLPDFVFPSEDFYSSALTAMFGASDAGELTLNMQGFFRIIAVTFSTHGSHSVLEVQSREVLARFSTAARVPPRNKTLPQLSGAQAPEGPPVQAEGADIIIRGFCREETSSSGASSVRSF